MDYLCLNRSNHHRPWLSSFVGNKAKGRISKRVFQENKARQIFRKNEHFLPPDMHRYVAFIFNTQTFIGNQKVASSTILIFPGTKFQLLGLDEMIS